MRFASIYTNHNFAMSWLSLVRLEIMLFLTKELKKRSWANRIVTIM